MSYWRMTYPEFRQSEFYQKPCQWFRLTIVCEDKNDIKAVIVQWEPSNQKWYMAEPYEGRKECGLYDKIWFDEEDWKIKQIRPL